MSSLDVGGNDDTMQVLCVAIIWGDKFVIFEQDFDVFG
jgi:hypothetical protein